MGGLTHYCHHSPPIRASIYVCLYRCPCSRGFSVCKYTLCRLQYRLYYVILGNSASTVAMCTAINFQFLRGNKKIRTNNVRLWVSASCPDSLGIVELTRKPSVLRQGIKWPGHGPPSFRSVGTDVLRYSKQSIPQFQLLFIHRATAQSPNEPTTRYLL